MDEKSLRVLELARVLERLARHASFSASRDAILASRPVSNAAEANRLLGETSEARALLGRHAELTIGGARDIRPLAEDAARGITLLPASLLEVRATLQSARTLGRALGRTAEEAPALSQRAARMPECPGLIETIGRTLNDEGVVLDSASERLASLRAEVRGALDRLLTRLNRVLAEHASHLQEPIITQRDGRYVVPLRAECKGRLRGIVHDQSASGATLFIEPLTVVDLGNRWREATLLEQEEVNRILAALSAEVGAQRAALLEIVGALADLDAAFSRAKYAEEIAAERPELVEFPERPAEDFSPLALYAARHPLLDPQKVVAADIALRPGVRALVITGPNTGGKTVALKTAGLLAVMAQCGMHIPVAAGSRLAFFDAVFADIGDEQSIEQSLSTFSAHVGQVIRILDLATPHSLVILDELGSGTDPQEGSALARALLAELLRRGISTLVATHYPELKVYAHNTIGTENASMEFDVRTLQPTYRLVLGLPGRSNALAIAKRLGLSETVLEEARGLVPDSDLESGRLLENIQRERDRARREREDAEKLNRRAREAERQLARRLEQIEEERSAILDDVRARAQSAAENLLREMRDLRRQAGEAKSAEQTALAVKAQALEERIETDKRIGGREPALTAPLRMPKVGQSVKLKSLQMPGKVLTVDGDQLEIQVGALRIRAALDDLSAAAAPAPEPPARKSVSPASSAPQPASKLSPGLEIDLRGKMVEEALIELDRYLDSASLAGLPWVRIIHGKGTGRLRTAIREALKTHALADSVESGGEREGGDGITIVHFS